MGHVHSQGFSFEPVLYIIFSPTLLLYSLLSCFGRTLWDLSPSPSSSSSFFFLIRTGLCLQLSALSTYFLPGTQRNFFILNGLYSFLSNLVVLLLVQVSLKILWVSMYLPRVQFMSKIHIFLRNTFLLRNTSQSASQTITGNTLKIFESSLLRKSISH